MIGGRVPTAADYRWGQHDTEALLGILTDSVDKFSNPNMKRKFIWKDSCRRMLEKGFNISQVGPNMTEAGSDIRLGVHRSIATGVLGNGADRH